jgi:hypothetical protein
MTRKNPLREVKSIKRNSLSGVTGKAVAIIGA